jgi:hypothetical protein
LGPLISQCRCIPLVSEGDVGKRTPAQRRNPKGHLLRAWGGHPQVDAGPGFRREAEFLRRASVAVTHKPPTHPLAPPQKIDP